jgi:hypothetical protein
VRVAVRSGLTVSGFDSLDENDKAYLIAYWRTIDSMTAYESQEAEDKAHHQSVKSKARR